jgi:hypothetical protein
MFATNPASDMPDPYHLFLHARLITSNAVKLHRFSASVAC